MLLGGLLVASGVLGPVAFQGGTSVVSGDLRGQAHFHEAQYTGDARVSASDAAIYASGSFDATAGGENVLVSVYEYERQTATLVAKSEMAGYGFRAHYKSDDRTTNETYDHARLRLSGQPDGELHVWPSAGAGTARYTLDLGASQPPSILASTYGARLYSDDSYHRRAIEGPAFALGNGAELEQRTELSHGGFEDLRASGSLQLIVSDADLAITHPDGTTTHELRTNPGREGEARAEGGSRVGYSVGTRVSYAVIRFPTGDVQMRPEGVDTVFLAHQPTWRINGTVTFDSENGSIGSKGEDRDLDDARVEVEGNLTLNLSAEGADPGQVVFDGWTLPEKTLPEPKVNASLDGDAREIRVDGDSVTAPAQPPVPEDVTLFARLIGLLVAAWGVGKKLLFFLVGLLTREPLENPRRSAIHSYLQEAGVAHMREIQRQTDIPIGSLVYHLKLLREEGIICRVRQEGRHVYYVPSDRLGREQMERLALLSTPTRRQIARALVELETASQGELAEHLGLSQSSVSRQLEKLDQAHLVDASGSWAIEYTPTELLREWLTGR